MVMSCNQDQKPRLTELEDHIDTSTSMKEWYTTPDQDQLSHGVRSLSSKLRSQHPENEKIIGLFEGVAVYNMRQKSRSSEHADIDGAARSILLHHLISLLSAQQTVDFDSEASIIGEILRLTSLIFVLSKGRGIPGTAYLSHTAQMRKLKNIFEFHEPDWRGMMDLRAWVVAMALVNAEGEEDVEWWTVEWRIVLRALAEKELKPVPSDHSILEISKSKKKEDEAKVKSGNDLIEGPLSIPYQVSDIMWIERIHEKRYQELFGKPSTNC